MFVGVLINGKLMVYGVPIVLGHPKTINFLFVPNGKLMVLDVQLFNHIRVYQPLQINRLVCMFDDTRDSI